VDYQKGSDLDHPTTMNQNSVELDSSPMTRLVFPCATIGSVLALMGVATVFYRRARRIGREDSSSNSQREGGAVDPKLSGSVQLRRRSNLGP